MFTIYVYILDTLADWELGYVTSELHSGRFFKKDAPRVSLQTVSASTKPIRTMGGMTVVPDCLVDDIVLSNTSILLLPGANTWNDKKHQAILNKACSLLSLGGTVCAICGATGALLFAKQIISHLGVFRADTLKYWYQYFGTGDPQYYFALMQTLSSGHED